jgi:hypothetical protein
MRHPRTAEVRTRQGMRIHLDTRDIINLIERGIGGVTPDDLEALLLQGHHTLVLSFPLICEIAEPLWDPNSTTSLTRTMRRVEEFPHEWIDTGHLPELEARTAMEVYGTGQPYIAPNPYVGSFLETLEDPPAEVFGWINYTLPEIVFDLWRSGTFDPREQKRRHVRFYRELFRQERELLQGLGNRLAARRAAFIRKFTDRMRRVTSSAPVREEDRQPLQLIAETVYQNPAWCPSVRLAFEAFHSLVEDVGDQLEDGDLGDFFNLQALPYVDLFTTDKRIATHINRVDRRLGLNYSSRVRPNVLEIVRDM